MSLEKSQILWVFLVKNLWVMLKRRVKFFESYWKNLWTILKIKFSSLCRIFEKSSILWGLKKISKIQFFDSCSRNFHSWSHFFKQSSILRVSLKNVQFIESHSKRFDSLSHTPKRGRFYSFSLAQKKIQLFELHSKKVQFFESDKKKFNSYWEEVHKRGSVPWIVYKEFNSLSHFSKKKISILWVFSTQSSILWIRFNSLSILTKVQFFESHWKTRKVRFFESERETSTLWVILKRGS